MGIFPTALRNKKYVSSHKKYLTLLPQCIACYLTCKHAIPTLSANNQCKHSIQTFNVNIQFEHSLQTFNSNISRKHATWQYSNIIPSMFTPCPGANILGLLKSERRGKPNCVFFAFVVLCTCGINYFAIFTALQS